MANVVTGALLLPRFCRARVRRETASTYRVICASAFPSGSGLPRRRLPQRTKRPLGGAPSDEWENGEDDNDAPISLAALSKSQPQQPQRQKEQPPLHNEHSSASTTQAPAPRSSRHQPMRVPSARQTAGDPAPAARRQARPGSASLSGSTTHAQPATLSSPHTPHSTPSGTVVTATAASKAAAAPSGLRSGLDASSGLHPAVSRLPQAHPDAGVAQPPQRAPEPAQSAADRRPRHPPVAFRTVAELRRMLQAASSNAAVSKPQGRQGAAVGEEAAPAAVAHDVAAAVANCAAREAPPRPPPSPRRFFATPAPSPPIPATDLATSTAAATAASHAGEAGVHACCRMAAGSSSSSSHSGNDSFPPFRVEKAREQDDGRESPVGAGHDTGDGGGDGSGTFRPDLANERSQQSRNVGDSGRPVVTAPVSAVAPRRSPAPERASTPASRPAAAAELDLDQDSDYRKAKRHALLLLQRSPLPTGELARRLATRGHPERVVQPLLSRLAEAGVLLSDRTYARLYAASKWNSSLAAPAKIKRDLAAQGLAAADVAAGLEHVFGPSQRIRLTGPTSAEELAIREALLEGARKHVETRASAAAAARSLPRERTEAGSSSSQYGSSSNQGSSPGSAASDRVARAKDQNAKRRRLAMWLQYRGHEMDLVLKVFQLLKI